MKQPLDSTEFSSRLTDEPSPSLSELAVQRPKLNISLSSPSTVMSEVDSTASDLTRLAIEHLDKHQWRLPLMEMDKKFLDRSYYKHYTDSYISSLGSKLGSFLTDNRLRTNPMKFHLQNELDNYNKYSQMFYLLTEYYRSLGSGFFSFATPSPDEEIIIGCRLGTKGCYRTDLLVNLSLRTSV